MNNQKEFANIILITYLLPIILVVALAGVAGYFVLRKPVTPTPQVALPTSQTSQTPTPVTNNNVSPQANPSNDFAANWKTYRNDIYGFELKYPSVWTLRDGNKDYKSAGLNNFYQFCNKVITTPDEPLGPNDNFVGRCEGENFRVNIWKPTAEMKMIANDFATLKLNKENKIAIGGKSASDFIYFGYSEILAGPHTSHLFVVQTNKYIYSITGDSCMDNKTDCNQILSTFKFIQ